MSGRVKIKALVCLLVPCFLLCFLMVPAFGGNPVALAATGWEQQVSGTTGTLNDISAVDAQTAWAVGNSGTILKTIDAGVTWSAQQSDTTNNLYRVKAVNKDVAWALSDARGAPIYKTEDGGATWQAKYSELNSRFVSIAAVGSDTAWALSTTTQYFFDYTIFVPIIFKTADGGATWYRQYGGIGSEDLKGITAIDRDNVVAAGWHNIVKTTDGGSSWTRVAFDPGNEYSIKALVSDANTVWSLQDQIRTVGGVWYYQSELFKTVDGGASWTRVLDAGMGTGDYLPLRDITAANPDVLWAVGAAGKIFRTTNGGGTWNLQASGVSVDLRGACAVGADEAWAVGDNGTILHTTEGGGGGLPVPSVASMSPVAGPAGIEVTLKGSGFGAAQGSGFVAFDTVKVTRYSAWSDTEIRFEVPQAAAVGQTLMSIANDYMTVSGFDVFNVTDTGPPVITSISPDTTTNYSTPITVKISGSGFSGAWVRLEQGSSVIQNYGSVASDGKLTAVLSPTFEPLGRYDVVVRNLDGQEARLPGAFTITDACGQGGGTSITLFAGLVGFLSLAGFGLKSRRR
jgi:photosystem II stability/assembly factor-like uncharacterized protein